jgi:hypothetical protein
MYQSQSVTKEVINETRNANLLRSYKHHLHSRPHYDKERPNAIELNSQNRKEKTKRSVLIAGDSIIQHVHGWELSNEDYNVAVKSFSSSKLEDMKDYLKPLIRRKPDEIILHIGTNNLKDADV